MKSITLAALLILASSSSGRAASASAPKAAASTPHPLATRVAIETLRSGGNAIDAAVAAAFVLAAADPSSATLGGGGLLLWFDASTDAVWALDFRELAPHEVPMGDGPGSAIAVPGFTPGLAAAHDRFGALNWTEVLAPATALAGEGALVTPALASRFAQQAPRVSSAAFLGDQEPARGVRLATGDLAETLKQIAREPRAPFRGSHGRRLAAFLAEAGSTITLLDLESYEPVWRGPIRIDRGGARIYAFPPPSGGGVTLMHLAKHSSVREDAAALRDAALHRLLRMGDPERTRFDLAAPIRDIDLPQSPADETSGGSSIAIADESGNAAVLVLTIGSPFGSGIVTPSGFVMNDSMRDFDPSGARGVNSPESNRRPGTSMTPVIVTRDGSVVLAAASGGGGPASSAIALFTLRVLDGMPPDEALALPRYHHDGVPDRLVVEQGAMPAAGIAELTERGQAVRPATSLGEIHAVVRSNDSWIALADPRGGGAPGGY